jgi:uncharacterized protein DUF5709
MERHDPDVTEGAPEDVLEAPDEPRAAEDTGTTAEEQREGASLDERLAEEEPDWEPGARAEPGRLIDESDGVVDREKDEVAEEAEADREEPSAEEDAIRIDEDPAGATGGPDHYVEEGEGAG